MEEKKVKFIGICGGAGAGKSTVAQAFARLGAKVLALDDLAHELYKDDKVKDDLIQEFGQEIVKNNQIDRDMLREKALSRKDGLEALNRIFFPLFDREAREFCQKLKENKTLGIIDGTVLLEANLDKYVDLILYLEGDPITRIQRFARRKGISLGLAKEMIDKQILKERKELAEFDGKKPILMVENNSDIQSMIEGLFSKLKGLSLLILMLFSIFISGCGNKEKSLPPPPLVEGAITMYFQDKKSDGEGDYTANTGISDSTGKDSEYKEILGLKKEQRGDMLFEKLFVPPLSKNSVAGRKAEPQDAKNAAQFLQNNRPHDALRAAENMIMHNPRNPEIVMRGEFIRAMAFMNLNDKKNYEEAMGKSLQAMALVGADPELVKFRDKRTRMQESIEAIVPWKDNVFENGLSGEEPGDLE